MLPPAPARGLSLRTQPLERGNAEPGLFRKAISRQERKGRGGKLGGWGAEKKAGGQRGGGKERDRKYSGMAEFPWEELTGPGKRI